MRLFLKAIRKNLRKQRMIIIIGESGRLGNKLNLFAHFIAFSLEHNIRISFYGFMPYHQLFESIHNNHFCQVPYPNSKSHAGADLLIKLLLYLNRFPKCIDLIPYTTNIFAYNKSDYCNLSLPKYSKLLLAHPFTFVHGYFFRDFDSVKKHAIKIREILSPLPEYREVAEGYLASARKEADIIIGIHIRHGDYTNWQQGQHFFTVTQYQKIMHSLQNLFKSTKVLYLVSSDAEWTSDHFPDLNVVIADCEPIVAMHSLSLCDYLVGPKSSFNRWASFYGNVPLYTVRDPVHTITKADFQVNYLDDLYAIQ